MYASVFGMMVALAADPAALAVEADFPGGSATVESIDQDARRVRIDPEAYEDRGWACWWYFKLTGIEPGETVTIDVGEAPWATPDRAAFSLDGKQWERTPPGKRDGKRIVYQHRVDGREAYFAWGPPFVPDDARRLVERSAEASPHAEAIVLCETREGRPTYALRVAEPGAAAEQRRGVWIQARQHAWESASSWVANGLVDWLISEDAAARQLRQTALITVVPIMDVDNVHRGAGGKNQVPQDHNRDWSDSPYWRSVAAAQQAIRAMDADGRFDLFVDLHNPGANSRHPFFYVAPEELLSDTGRENLRAFLAAARAEMTGPLAFQGKTIPSGANYDKQWQAISKNWVTTNTAEHVVALTLETAWNTPHNQAKDYQRVGRELGLAIERYLRSAKKP